MNFSQLFIQRRVATILLALGLGMAGLFTRLQSRSKKLAITGLLFTVIALALATANLVLLSGVLGAPSFKDTFMGLSIFSLNFLGDGLRDALDPRIRKE